jgi:hypothetical protein
MAGLKIRNKKMSKKMSKSCQKVVKKLSKISQHLVIKILKRVGGEGEGDFVAPRPGTTLSHLVKSFVIFC